MSSHYYEIATCSVSEQRVDQSRQPFNFVVVTGTTCHILDKRPQEPPEIGGVGSDEQS